MSGLQNSGVAPNGHNYNVIINAHLKRDDEAGALYYWQLLKQSGLKPHLYDFTSFMHYYSSKGNVRAVKVSNCMLASNVCENQMKSVCQALEKGSFLRLVCALHCEGVLNSCLRCISEVCNMSFCCRSQLPYPGLISGNSLHFSQRQECFGKHLHRKAMLFLPRLVLPPC